MVPADARLAQEGLADATAAFVPPADLWAGIKDPVVQQMIDSTGASDWERWQLSPAMHSSQRPVLAQIMRQDRLLNTDAQWSWVDRDPRVEGQQVEGTHVWPVTPADRTTHLTSAMDFLKRKTKGLRLSALARGSPTHTRSIPGVTHPLLQRPHRHTDRGTRERA